MIGRILGNRYEIIEKIGGGGMSNVYKAKCKVLNRFVAIKILRDELTQDPDFIDKFKQESLSAASLTHPNIVNIYDTGIEDGIYYIVMELVRGETLKNYIKRNDKLSEQETVKISRQVAEALKHAHTNNIVHRDIKPHNILITEDGTAKVTDFGIARASTSSTINNTSNVIGSVHYFSPEQARGGYVDEKSDIYSLGIVMYLVQARYYLESSLAISMGIFVVALLLMWIISRYRLNRKMNISIKNMIITYLLLLYIIVILKVTGILGMTFKIQWFLEAIKYCEISVPFVGSSILMVTLNLLLFVPLGFLITAVFKKD